MTNDNDWIDLQVGLLELGLQRARVRVKLTPPELIAAVLREFRGSLEFLSSNPSDYELRVGHGSDALSDPIELGHQVSAGVEIHLVERQVQLPRDAKQINAQAFVRNMRSGSVTRITWWPAIIGRPDPKRSDNQLVAVDLSDEPTRAHISRRHLQLVTEGPRYFVEQIAADNPTVLIDGSGKRHALGQRELPIEHGNVIELSNSGVKLVFLQRPVRANETKGASDGSQAD